MISRLAEKAVDHIFPQDSLSRDDREVYIYGFFMLFSRIFFFLLTALWGMLLGVLLESVLLYAAFALIRAYAGGVHASRESTCTICTSLAMLLCCAAMRLCTQLKPALLPLVVLAFSAIVIGMLSPLDTEAKPLTEEEKREYRRKSILITFIILAAAILGLIVGIYRVFYPCVLSLFLESILLLAGMAGKTFRER